MDEGCKVEGCDRAHKARGYCMRHYQREFKREADGGRRHRHRSDQLIANRARRRATAWLVKEHADEYTELLEAAMIECAREAAELAETTGDEKSKLLPGPKPEDQSLAERVRTDVGTCPECIGSHDRGHTCVTCGRPPIRCRRCGMGYREGGLTGRPCFVDNPETKKRLLIGNHDFPSPNEALAMAAVVPPVPEPEEIMRGA